MAWSFFFPVGEEREHGQLQLQMYSHVTPWCTSQKLCADTVSLCSLHLLIGKSIHIPLRVLGTDITALLCAHCLNESCRGMVSV